MITEHHRQIYRDRFIHRDDAYARQITTGSYIRVAEPVTDAVIRAHLSGNITGAWYALTSDNTTRWVCLDADRADGLEQLQQSWAALDARGIPAALELSRRGGHLWIFFEPISAKVARRLILGILPDLDGVEVFPKRDTLSSTARYGNCVRGPLGIHQRSGKRYPFVDPGSLQPVSRTIVGAIEYLETVPRVGLAQAAELLATLLDERDRSNLETRPAEDPPSAHHEGHSRAERIRARIGDLHTFVSQFIELDASGRGHCPFHPPDHNPSFVVNRATGYWVDFHEVNPRTGRYLGGDAIAFYRRFTGCSYPDALLELAEWPRAMASALRNTP